MPELPEVETTRLGLIPALKGHHFISARVGDKNLRWPIPPTLNSLVKNQRILDVKRRAKYLIVELDNGNIIIHLGMSGNLRILRPHTPLQKHDHVDFILDNNTFLRYNDPRRFGAILWAPKNLEDFPLFKALGLEPLSQGFSAQYLFEKTRTKKSAIKNLIMDNHVVVGVGNIYATEALFKAHLLPYKAAHQLTLKDCENLVTCIKKVLQHAIEQGGTTLRDFYNSEGKPGYFAQELFVYGRNENPCKICGTSIKTMKIGQRTSAYCPKCQH